MKIKQNKAFIVTNCTENETVSQRVIMLSRKPMNGNNEEPEYTIDRFTIREDYAFVNDIIIRTFDHIMWIGTTDQNISFLVTTPIKDIYTSSFLNNEVFL